jgi:serine/threonine protein phosphatase PrpC
MAGSAAALRVSIGQHSEAGRKPANQDFHGACVPAGSTLAAKGIALAIADGISSSEAGRLAAEAAVRSFLDDYYCTADAWSVSRSAQRVLAATNSWLHAQTQRGQGRFDKDRGHVCTFSALVLKSTTAHLFHVGDTRICRWHGASIEPLTEDHRVSVDGEQSYLARALGVGPHVEIDYLALPLARGDVFLLCSDGVHEHLDAAAFSQALAEHPQDLDAAARQVVADALRRGSPDNLTLQILRVDDLPDGEASELHARRLALQLPPPLAARMAFDGYRIERDLHHSARSHLWLATDEETGRRVALKVPSTDLQHDEAALDRFLLEEWVARRIDNPHVLKPHVRTRPREHLYVAMEFVEGQTLAQWMLDHPRPSLETVRGIVEQVANGLQAFHRLEMLHQDLRPQNLMVDAAGTLRIIDFGSAWVAGLADDALDRASPALGTVQYMAPEYFLGHGGTPRSDQFSLGVIAYQLLTGRLPYGAQLARCTTAAAQRGLAYRPARDDERDLPAWVDAALRKAVHVVPSKRHEALSEFVEDLRRPSPDFLDGQGEALLQRHPLLFWKVTTLLLAVAVIALLGVLSLRG